ncbi:hypothetical protein B4Q13_20175 [Lacticaseibacillus rhamnosus]
MTAIRHFLDLIDIPAPTLREMIAASRAMKAERNAAQIPAARPLAGKTGTTNDSNDPNLQAWLVSPNGTQVQLFTHVGRRGSSNFTNTVLSDSAISVLVPVLDQVLGMRTSQIRTLFESNGLSLHDWERARTDRVMLLELPAASMPAMG